MRRIRRVQEASGRHGLRIAIVAAALTAAVVAGLWAHRQLATVPATAVPISAIVQDRGRWLGRQVQVRGGLLRFADAHDGVYGVLDDGGARLGLRHLDGWTALVGRRVIAVGTVEFDPRFGLYLAHPEVRVVPR